MFIALLNALKTAKNKIGVIWKDESRIILIKWLKLNFP